MLLHPDSQKHSAVTDFAVELLEPYTGGMLRVYHERAVGAGDFGRGVGVIMVIVGGGGISGQEIHSEPVAEVSGIRHRA